GAGVILRHGTQVRGLSTAATFWAVAAVGAAAGLQEFILAVALTMVVFFAHVALRSLSLWIERHAPPEDMRPRYSKPHVSWDIRSYISGRRC
ncbi:MAG: MgtC/SapB family protein, partial [Rhodopila sp.]